MKTKGIILAVVCMLATACYGQSDAIPVKFKGAKPTISDFAETIFSIIDVDDEEECANESAHAFHQTWIDYHHGESLDEGEVMIVDEKNGYVHYESNASYEGTTSSLQMELCYWNEADGRHKLIAYSCWLYMNGLPTGGQYDALCFWRYDNNTKKLSPYSVPGFEVDYSMAYSLPRIGKDITVTYVRNEKILKKKLKWDGRKFSY